MQIKYFFPLVISLFGILEPGVAQETITQDELVRRTQELFDAVVPGNPEPWKKYYAEDAMYADEKGRNLNKTALVADITPMPNGYSGTIKIVRPQSRIFGDAAILSYDLDETETIFGQNLKARYHETDTWLRRNGTWQIVAAQAFRYYEDPAIGKADVEKFPTFVGTYELAAGNIRTVTATGDNLFVERQARATLSRIVRHLFPERRRRSHPLSHRRSRQNRRAYR